MNGLSYTQGDMFLAEALQDQGNPYWSMMHANSYKYGFSGSIGSSYYNFSQLYELNDYAPRLDGRRRQWENPLPSGNVEVPQVGPYGSGGAEPTANTNTEERVRANNTSSPQQYIWQDSIDPDSMTYEELLDLGESVGSQSRGLSQERISSLPVTKYKCSFFSRKKKQNERCVICQMDYKRRDRQMTLPCKHVYHSGCVSRWLNINKACPVCSAEVPNDEPRR
ncbi:E3 ubiquitin ligase BIG BROTHER-like isoform X2 [Phalaenopsis equestris]|uniref:E3 ubiquitin ligase BIG BROTHER-like isoform X2 n=1 Tax=Phalaenopsis equestris TaxID=78828 RepID=UPI0009E4BAE1|nr:E3 ubiquitin ligase BIG BROTHER-like isoform X2 [Phalaenopsis equestris]